MRKSVFRICAASLGAVVLTVFAASGCKGKHETAAASSATPTAGPPRASRVILEVDRMTDTPPIPESVTVNGQQISLQSIYGKAGVEIVVRPDQIDLPRVEKIREADLHGLMTSFASVPAPPGAAKIHALVVTAHDQDPEMVGVMFDFDSQDLNLLPREGFAIFASPFQHFNNAAAELFLTTAHELAHCFNLHHPDWEGEDFWRDGTIESYNSAARVRWTLSANSLRHLREHQLNEVWPGKGGLPFGSVGSAHLGDHNSSPGQLFSVVGSPAARGIGPRGARARMYEANDHPLRLNLEAPKTSYVIGEPVVLTVGLHNAGSTDRYVLPLLDPRYQFLNVEIRKKGSGDFEVLRPAVLADARGIQAARLQPGDSLHEEVKVFFGAKGWTFEEPGVFEVRADYLAGGATPDVYDEREGRVQSPVLELEIRAPVSPADRLATKLVSGYEQGLFIFLDGASHLRRAKERLERVVEEAPQAASAPSARLALAQAMLNPVPVRGNRVVTEDNVRKAQKYLRGLPIESLPPLSVVRASKELTTELAKRRDTSEAIQVRRETVRRMERQEAVREEIRTWRVNPGATPPQ